MPKTINTIYENGVFKPLEPVSLKEHERVTLDINLDERLRKQLKKLTESIYKWFSTPEFFIKILLLIAITLLPFSIIINPPLSLAENENPKYVGSSACRDCHKEEYENFMKYAKKARSFENIERLKKGLTDKEIKECYFCHTTGYGKTGGFISPEKTPYLKNAGCEVCHGPGEFHVKTKSREDIKISMTMKDCEVCHTAERVKAFRFKPMIHGGAH